MCKPKVLLVPGWYPELSDSPLRSFFQEQMWLLENDFDFKVFVGQRSAIGRKKFINQILHREYNLSKRIDYKYLQKEQTIAIDYTWVKMLPKFLEQKQYKKLNKIFDSIFKNLESSNWKPDLIHIQSLSDTAVFACNLGEKYNIPVILTEHNVYSFRGIEDFFEKERQNVYEKVNKVLCVSNHVLRHLLINNFNLKSFSIIGNFVDDRHFVFQERKRKTEKYQIIFVAGHYSCKDIHILIQTARYLVDSGFTNFFINIIGLEIDKSFYYYYTNSNYSLKEEIDKSGLSDYFGFRGIVSGDKMTFEYQDNSILVSTSFSETFGLSIAEALLCGLPVVCTDSGGPRDFINEINGIIVPIRDPKALGDAIVKVFDNIAKYNGKQISDEIRERFGAKVFSETITNEYRSAMYDK
ncbi:MAG: glycosyltransferase family 4 protein [Paludibacter sp.]|nr:glycosyltransferase family 4 protein [Paludibacter sp.]